MSLKQFYRLAMILPVLLPTAAWPFAGESFIATVLSFSLFFGGTGYVVFYLVMCWLLGRLNTDRAIIRLIWICPFVFVPFQVAAILLYAAYAELQDPNVQWDFFMLPAFAVYDLVFGYVYVLFVETLRMLVFRLPKGPNMRSNKQLQGDGSPAARRA